MQALLERIAKYRKKQKKKPHPSGTAFFALFRRIKVE